jgi:hypothetical protein
MADNVGSLEEVIKNASRQAKTTASFGAFKNGEINMSLSDKIKAFFASDEASASRCEQEKPVKSKRCRRTGPGSRTR